LCESEAGEDESANQGRDKSGNKLKNRLRNQHFNPEKKLNNINQHPTTAISRHNTAVSSTQS